MKYQALLVLILCLVMGPNLHSQQESFRLAVKVTLAPELEDQFQQKGRMFLFISENLNVEPRTQIWPNPRSKTHIFAKNVDPLEPSSGWQIAHDDQWISTADWTLDAVPEGEYNLQILWDQDVQESRISAPGNLYSEKQRLVLDKSTEFDLVLSQAIAARKVDSHDLCRVVEYESKVLSDWWDRPMTLKASVLLPHAYDEGKEYPIRYNVAGYGGRYTRINRLLNNEDFMKWWDSEEAPQIITVFLDGEGPFGDSYQMDSDNSGPYGTALIDEFIPHIEQQYRGTQSVDTRFVDGCSTGGWVSLGLQLYYPDVFGGVYSYSPDAIEFENYQLINIYKDKNAFVNEYGYPRPVMRSTMGEPMLSLEDFIQYENVLGSSNTYLNSGGQFSAHTALYSPKGDDGLPKALFDPQTGVIDSTVADHWKKYDFKLHVQEHWNELGPKLQDKIYIWMGDMDHFYLNPATRAFADHLEQTSDPKSNAEIIFSPMEGHCSQYSHRTVLEQIQERLQGDDGDEVKGRED